MSINFEAEYYKAGQLIHKLETRIHKSRHAYRILRRTFRMTINDVNAASKQMDELRHQVAATRLQSEKLIKSLEPILEENKRLKDELAFYKAKEGL